MLEKTLKLRENKKGFTLVEMLIVIAIIAILVAVAIPVYTTQMNTSRERVDEANLRAAKSMAVADYLLNNSTGDVTYGAVADGQGGFEMKAATTATLEGKSSANKDKVLSVIVNGGAVKSISWD